MSLITDETPNQVNRPHRVGTSLPSTCKRGDIYFLVGTVNKIYASFAVDTWTEIFSSSGPTLPASSAILNGLTAGQKIASGKFTPTNGTTTVATGLTTVTHAVATIKGSVTTTQLWVTTNIGDQAGTPVAGSVIIKVWKGAINYGVLGATLSTSNFADVEWIAVGT